MKGPTSLKTYGGHMFSRVPSTNIPRSRFDRSHTLKTTLNGGYLVPIAIQETLPADTVSVSYKQICRMTTPIAPFMDNVRAYVSWWHVPRRLVWEHFEDFITGGDEPDNWEHPADYLYPTIDIPKAALTNGSLFDYCGLPTNIAGDKLTVNALPFRAINLIYNEWFRDENIIDKIPFTKADSGDTYTDYVLRKRGKRKDYFTSALPAPMKGPAVDLPLGDVAPVNGTGMTLGLMDGRNHTAGLANYTPGGTQSLTARELEYGANIGTATSGGAGLDASYGLGVTTDPMKSGLVADLSTATAASINEFRQAFQLQLYYEALARGGSRYTEWLLSMFGTKSPDARLQRPEYLGGGTIEFMTQAVAQTSASDNVTPQGNLAAVSTATDLSGKIGFTKSFTEHGYLIAFICIYTDAEYIYQQGLNKMWKRSTRFDEYLPVFAHLGEQPVYNYELYCQGTSDDTGVFAYQERYAELRYQPSMITGKLRSNDAQSLDVWHLAQYFGELPTLSQNFIEENPPFSRVLAVQNEPEFILSCAFTEFWTRALPTFSVPGRIDHY